VHRSRCAAARGSCPEKNGNGGDQRNQRKTLGPAKYIENIGKHWVMMENENIYLFVNFYSQNQTRKNWASLLNRWHRPVMFGIENQAIPGLVNVYSLLWKTSIFNG